MTEHFGLGADGDQWKEYRAIQMEAEAWEKTAKEAADANPRGAKVAATLAVSKRIEALTYVISKAKVF